MTTIHVVRRDGTEHVIDAKDGASLMQAIRLSSAENLLALCGGSCSCATCHVIVAPDWIEKVGQAEDSESDLLWGSPHRDDGSRLSCQIKVTPALEGLRVKVAPED